MIYPSINNKGVYNSDYLQDQIYNLLDLTFIIPKSYIYNVYEVTKEYIARPDLISLDAYGDTMYTDIICKLNGISNPFELNEGMKIIIPSPEYIQEFVITPDPSEADDKWGKRVSIPVKTKQSKRQANESILGDSRFKIDKNKGIIIY